MHTFLFSRSPSQIHRTDLQNIVAFSMHLLIPLQMILPVAIIKPCPQRTYYILSPRHRVLSSCLIFAKLIGKQCYLALLIRRSLIISEVEHFLDTIDRVFLESLLRPQFTCRDIEDLLGRGGRFSRK